MTTEDYEVDYYGDYDEDPDRRDDAHGSQDDRRLEYDSGRGYRNDRQQDGYEHHHEHREDQRREDHDDARGNREARDDRRRESYDSRYRDDRPRDNYEEERYRDDRRPENVEEGRPTHQDERRQESYDGRYRHQDNYGDQYMDEEVNRGDHGDDKNERFDNDYPPQHGTKRKSPEDDRPVDPGATTALLLSDLSWWTSDDDIRGWVRDAECEDELKDITFSEHKVNGKSKGQVYVEFYSPQAATATKYAIEDMQAELRSGQKHFTMTYYNPALNPFKTLPKDAPARGKDQNRTQGGQYNDRGNHMGNNNHGGSNFGGNNFNNNNNFGGNNFGGGFRGRGGYNRGGMNHNFNRNFNNNNSMGFNNNMGGGGFNGPMGGGNFGGFNRGNMMGGGMRGGPGGMRGGRGGGNMLGMNPMGGMPMGMHGGMGMGMMGPNGIPNFQGMNQNFNPGFGFNQNHGGGGGGGGDWGNPHGAKRPRPE